MKLLLLLSLSLFSVSIFAVDASLCDEERTNKVVQDCPGGFSLETDSDGKAICKNSSTGQTTTPTTKE